MVLIIAPGSGVRASFASVTGERGTNESWPTVAFIPAPESNGVCLGEGEMDGCGATIVAGDEYIDVWAATGEKAAGPNGDACGYEREGSFIGEEVDPHGKAGGVRFG